MKASAFKRDSSRVEAGEWVDDIPGFPGIRLKVRGLQSLAFSDAQAKLQRQVPAHKRAEDGSIDPAMAYAIMGKAMQQAVLLDWDGLQDDDGKPLAYDADLAMTWLTDMDYSHFAEAVMAAAQVVDRRARSVDMGQVEKN
jgi:hypothetical protein